MIDHTKTIEALTLEIDRLNAENAVLKNFFDSLNEMTLRAEQTGMIGNLGHHVKAYMDFMRQSLEGAKK